MDGRILRWWNACQVSTKPRNKSSEQGKTGMAILTLEKLKDQQVRSHLLLLRKFKARLGYMRLCHQNAKENKTATNLTERETSKRIKESKTRPDGIFLHKEPSSTPSHTKMLH